MKHKNIVDFVREHDNKWTFDTCIWKLKMNKFVDYHIDFVLINKTIELFINDVPLDGFPVKTKDEYQGVELEIQDYLFDAFGIEIRFCDNCGMPMDRGMTSDGGGFYNCEECFPEVMNETYGKGNWRPCEDEDGDENSEGGYYEYFENGKWHDEPSYYTEWN